MTIFDCLALIGGLCLFLFGMNVGQAFEVYKINDLSVKDFCRAEIKLTIHKNNTLNALILRHIWLLDECVFVCKNIYSCQLVHLLVGF